MARKMFIVELPPNMLEKFPIVSMSAPKLLFPSRLHFSGNFDSLHFHYWNVSDTVLSPAPPSPHDPPQQRIRQINPTCRRSPEAHTQETQNRDFQCKLKYESHSSAILFSFDKEIYTSLISTRHAVMSHATVCQKGTRAFFCRFR